jgi:hypothetical protein
LFPSVSSPLYFSSSLQAMVQGCWWPTVSRAVLSLHTKRVPCTLALHFIGLVLFFSNRIYVIDSTASVRYVLIVELAMGWQFLVEQLYASSCKMQLSVKAPGPLVILRTQL